MVIQIYGLSDTDDLLERLLTLNLELEEKEKRKELKQSHQCRICQFYAHSEYLICAIHPEGISGDTCPDFLFDPKVKEFWTPIGFTLIDVQLYRKLIVYDRDQDGSI